jgi:hypothetical protein
MFIRRSHDLPWDAFRPVTIRKKPVNYVEIQKVAAGADQELAAPVFDHSFGISFGNGRHSNILPLRYRRK